MRYGLIAIMIVLFFFIGTAFGQEPTETVGLNKTATSGAAISVDIVSFLTVLIFSVTILLVVIISTRVYSNTSRITLEKAFERNKELPMELQEPVSVIIKAFPQAEPLGLPRGSLRAVVMLIFSLAFVFLLFLPSKQADDMVKTLEIILAILIGFYFGSRHSETRTGIKSEIAKKEAIEGPKISKEALGIKEIPKKIVYREIAPENRKNLKRRGRGKRRKN